MIFVQVDSFALRELRIRYLALKEPIPLKENYWMSLIANFAQKVLQPTVAKALCGRRFPLPNVESNVGLVVSGHQHYRGQ